jgi:lipoprotein-anchoring transpeptidase ErfK/SrfK
VSAFVSAAARLRWSHPIGPPIAIARLTELVTFIGEPLTLDRRAHGASLAAVLAVLAVLGGLVISSTPQCPGNCHVVATSRDVVVAKPSPTEPAVVQISPPPGAEDITPVSTVMVTAASGTLTDVSMVNDAGKAIPGVLAADNRTWKPAEQLGYGRTYTMTIAGRGPGGMPTRQTSSFSTLSPDYQARVYFNDTAGNLLADGATMGVGAVIVAHFDEPITDKASAERRLKVTTNPIVQGSWYWLNDQKAHWRPEKYWAPGTTVTVNANIYGTPLGDGLYGASDEQVSFKIGDSHVAIADDKTKQVQVFENGKLVRTMPTSMGKGGTQIVDGKPFSFWTPPGVYTVIGKSNPVVMDSSTYGLPVNSRLGYRRTIPFATRISNDGIYLHQLNDTIWAQGNTNVSSGCLNLSGDNAEWFYNFSNPGDIVEVRNTGGPPLQVAMNGDWTVPWAEWRKGSKLP